MKKAEWEIVLKVLHQTYSYYGDNAYRYYMSGKRAAALYNWAHSQQIAQIMHEIIALKNTPEVPP
jgi:hypothetical protein